MLHNQMELDMTTTFSRSQASDAAIALVKAGLESGSIKLYGISGSGDTPANAAKADAEYLETLINALVEKIKSPDFN